MKKNKGAEIEKNQFPKTYFIKHLDITVVKSNRQSRNYSLGTQRGMKNTCNFPRDLFDLSMSMQL